MATVFIKKASYDYEILKLAIFEMIDSIGADLVKRHDRVLIKPNFLRPSEPEEAILTHPLVVKAAVEYVLLKGGSPFISDSPGRGPFKKIFEAGGYKQALEGLDCDFGEFKESVTVDIGKPFGRIEIAREAVEADVVISLPKLKTHTQMVLTLGVKNLFGCIVGLRKPEWHFRAGVDREAFAKLLVGIYKAINPAVTLVDGILAMDGQGPGKSGNPRYLGVLVGSGSALALDMAICRMLGIDPEKVPTNKAARELGMAEESIDVNGDFDIVNDFELPELGSLGFGPRPLHGFIRRHLLQRPVANTQLCRSCGECLEYCPAKAISFDRERVVFDYNRCIRCYCCIEVCPCGALRAVEPLPGRILKRLS